MIFLNLLYVFQDYSYWTRSVPMQHLTVHIALDQQVTIVAVNPIVANSTVIAVNNVNFKVPIAIGVHIGNIRKPPGFCIHEIYNNPHIII